MRSAYVLLLLACSGDDKSVDTASNDVEDTSAVSDTTDTNTSTDTDDDTTGRPETNLVDPECVDGQYSEVLPNPAGDISPFVSGYSAGNVYDFIDGVLGARYATGQYLFVNGYNSQGGFPDNCLNYFLGDSSSASAVIGQLSTIVHECGHFLDMSTGGWGENGYHFTPDLVYTCTDGRTPDNGGGRTFARSLINNDEYAALHPPCANYTDQGCDSYAAIYLNGDPNNGTFESGDQGYGMLHEETLQYINSLATSYAFTGELNYSTSARDGILTFLWYTMRYLRMARLEHPDAYALLTEDSCWRDMILTTWGRAWLYLELTSGNRALGINDAFLETLVMEPDLLEEIQRLRDIEGCNQ